MENETLIELSVCEYDDEEELMHYGTKRHSGRYPWGSGKDKFQRPSDFSSYVKNLETKGLSEAEIAEGLGMTSTQLRAYKSVAKNLHRKDMVDMAKSLYKDSVDKDGKPMTKQRIGEIVGEKYNNGVPIGESTIRSFLNENRETRMNSAQNTADILMKSVDEKGLIDIGAMVNKELGVSSENFKQAIAIAKAEGYVVLKGSVEQQGHPGQFTHLLVLAPSGTPDSAVYEYGKINQVIDYTSNDNGKSFRKYRYPASLDSKRVAIRYKEDGGIENDGVVEIRRGVKDLSLGTSQYAQVRILVDGTHYIKGMAVYSDGKDMPDGVDVLFNSKKPRGTPKLDCLKSVADNLKKDPTNPFGANLKEKGGQMYYDDPNGDSIDPITGHKQSLSPINKRAEQGDWDDWSRTLPSQFLSKQPKALISKQLNLSEVQRQDEFDEIMSINNPTVKSKLLEDFANNCDSAAVELKSVPIPGTNYHVILPSSTLKDDEVYAPNYENGTQVALVRFPHGGTFEIPILTVNNNNKECREKIGTSAQDAICINANVAGRLSGADFDGDTVLTIPTNDGKVKIKSTPEIPILKGFNTDEYGPDEVTTDEKGEKHYFRNGVEYKHIDEGFKQKQMGIVSNLITDMTLHGASPEEIGRATKFSMVIIDSYKHHLDYKSCAAECNINELKKRYQKHADDERYGGASTIISRSGSPYNIPKRAEGKIVLNQEGNPDNGNELEVYDGNKRIYIDRKTGKKYTEKDKKNILIDPKTGELLYHDTKEGYTKVSVKDNNDKKVAVPGYIKINDKYVRPRYEVVEDTVYYRVNEDGTPYIGKGDEKPSEKASYKFKAVKDLKTIEFTASEVEVDRMSVTKDASELSSGTIQERYYVEYANKLKALANQARKEKLYCDAHPIPYSPSAKEAYYNEYKSLSSKVELAELNAPKERAANLLAAANVKQMIANSDVEPSKDDIRKWRQRELMLARQKYGAKNMRFEITPKEWEAVQHGAFTVSRLQQILRYADPDIVKKLATPRDETKLTDSDIRRIKGFASKGETNAAIAKRLGISVSTVNKYLSGKEN